MPALTEPYHVPLHDLELAPLAPVDHEVLEHVGEAPGEDSREQEQGR